MRILESIDDTLRSPASRPLVESTQAFQKFFGDLRSLLTGRVDTIQDIEALIELVAEMEAEDDTAYQDVVVPYMFSRSSKAEAQFKEAIADALAEGVEATQGIFIELVYRAASIIDARSSRANGSTTMSQGQDVVMNTYNDYEHIVNTAREAVEPVVDLLMPALLDTEKSSRSLAGAVQTALMVGLRDKMTLQQVHRRGNDAAIDDREIKKFVDTYAAKAAKLLVAFFKDTSKEFNFPST